MPRESLTSATHEVGSVGASAAAKGRPEQGSAPLGGSEPREAGSAGATHPSRYLEYVRVEKRLAARTVALYALDLQRLIAFAAKDEVALLDVTTAHIRRWAAQMHGAGRSGRGISLILSGWRGFYVWLGRQGLIAVNPVLGVRAPKAGKPLPKALSVDDAVQLASYKNNSTMRNIHDPCSLIDLELPGEPATLPTQLGGIDESDFLELRDHVMTELLYGSGLRVGELVALDAAATAAGYVAQRGWIDVQAAEVHVCGKGSKWRSVPVGQQAMAALVLWLPARARYLAQLPLARSSSAENAGAAHGQTNPAAALFLGRGGTRLTSQSIWQRLRRRGVQAGLATPVHPHMLRHSFASHVLQSSGDLRAVQELLGHANITTTQVYTRLDFQHLAKAYDAAHPRAKRAAQSDDTGR